MGLSGSIGGGVSGPVSGSIGDGVVCARSELCLAA